MTEGSGDSDENKRQLEQYRAITEVANDVIITIDETSTIRSVNPAVEDVFGYTQAELTGASLTTLMPDEYVPQHRAGLADYLQTGERNIDWDYVELPGVSADGEPVPLGISFGEIEYEGERFFTGIIRDITPQKEAEAEMMRHASQQEAIAEFGRYALETPAVESLRVEATDLVAEILDAEFSTVLEFDPDGDELRPRATTGLPEHVAETATLSLTGARTHAGFALTTEESVVVEDFETDVRFELPEGLAARDVRSGICVIIGSPDDPWGVLTVHDTSPREFTKYDANIMESIAHVLTSAINRHQRTSQLRTQRAQLEAITQVYRIVQDIMQAVVKQSTREEIEQTVCDRLVDYESYEFAWIGELDLPEQTLSPTTSAGAEDGYLDEIRVTANQESHGRGPGGRALRTKQTQVVTDVADDESFEPWREQALERGIRSVAAIPITYEQTTFGVLGVYATERNAFGPDVQDVFDMLGVILGHAINAITQRDALHADALTQVDLRVEGIMETLGFGESAVESLQFDRMIPVGGGRYLMYGDTRVASDDASSLETLESVESVNVLSENGAERRVEVGWKEPPISSLVSSLGGRVRRGTLQEDVATVTVEFPPNVEVKSLVEQVERQHPEVEIGLRRRTTQTRTGSLTSGDASLLDPLTERQRTALEAAYYGGYFEWPRERNGADLADAMGISKATFSQHLRGAERQVFTRIFERDTGR